MPDTAVNPLVETITEQLKTLSVEDLQTIQDFVDYLVWKHQPAEAPSAVKKSAEALAIERIPDLDDPTKWITVIDEGDEVDEVELDSAYERLRTQGFEIEIPDQKP